MVLEQEAAEDFPLGLGNGRPPPQTVPLPQSQPDLADAINVSEDNPISLPILGADTSPKWSLSDTTFNWFRKVADLELKEDHISSVAEEFPLSDTMASDFLPPEIPPLFWNKIKTNPSDYLKQKLLYKAQKLNCLALRPLLSIVNNMTQNDPNMGNLTSAIQLICSSNLLLGRARRSGTVKFMKNEVKSNLMSQPVTHDNLFGTDFETAADQAVKSQSSVQKLLFTPKKPPATPYMQKPVRDFSSQNAGPSSSEPGPSHRHSDRRDRPQPFRATAGRSRGHARGRSRAPYRK